MVRFLIKYKTHIIFWCSYILLAYLMEIWRNPKNKFLDVLTGNLTAIFSFYSVLFSYKSFKKSKVLFSLYMVLSFIGLCLLRLAYIKILLPAIDVKPASVVIGFSQYINTSLRVFVVFSIYALGCFYAQLLIDKQKQLRVAERQQTENEKTKLEIENKNLRLQEDFLRAQINPHFLFNCLNFFYSETFEKHPYVGEGILMLSDIMRYSLKDFSESNGLANLAEEIEHIDNVINIHQMRFVNSLCINVKVEGEPEGKMVVPMVLITLVENVFKHGDLHDKNHPALIHCKIDELTKTVYFETTNKKKTGLKEPSTGIGLNNIQQRLQSLYQNNFSIATIEDDINYKKEITIPYFTHLHLQNGVSKIPNHSIC